MTTTKIASVGKTSNSIRTVIPMWIAEIMQLNKGDKIAQLIPIPVVNFEIEEVDELFKTERGGKGFGVC